MTWRNAPPRSKPTAFYHPLSFFLRRPETKINESNPIGEAEEGWRKGVEGVRTEAARVRRAGKPTTIYYVTTNLDASDGICNRRYFLYSWRWRHFPSFIRGSFSSLRYFFLTPSPPSTPLTYFVGLVKLTGDRASTASCVSVTDSRTTTCHEQRNRWEKLDSSIKWKNTCKGLENGLESKFEECKEKRNESTSNQVSESEGCSIGWSGGGMGLRRGGGLTGPW